MKFVINKGFAQELLELSMSRSVSDWELLFQLICLESGNFNSLAELEVDLMDLKANAAKFKTPRKSKVAGRVNEDIDVDPVMEILSVDEEEKPKTELAILRTKLLKEPEDDVASDEVEALRSSLSPLMDDKELLVQVVLSLLTHAADTVSVTDLRNKLLLLEQDTCSTGAKVVELLATIGELSNKSELMTNVQTELQRLSELFSDLNTQLESVNANHQKGVKKLSDSFKTLDSSSKSNINKSVRLFEIILGKQKVLEKDLNKVGELFKTRDKSSVNNEPSNPLDKMLMGMTDDSKNHQNILHNTSENGGNPKPSKSLCSMGEGCNCNQRFDAMNDLIATLQSEISTLKLNQEDGDSILRIGGFTFTSRDNLLLWARDNLPVVIPFGCFVDVYTFLNRMLDSVGADRSLHNLVDQHKLGLGGDDAITLESFQSPSPKLFGAFGSVSALKSSHRSWISTLPTATSWEDPRSSMGIRDRLRKQIPNIKEQVVSNINIRLANFPVGRALAMSCLNATITFVNMLSIWITDTHSRLTSHGYSTELSWQLVTQVVHHVFTSDLDKSRNFIGLTKIFVGGIGTHGESMLLKRA